MKDAIFKLVAFTFFAFLFGVVFWIGGRIILPEMGLRAPGFWSWFWFSAFVVNFLLWFWLVVSSRLSRPAGFWT